MNESYVESDIMHNKVRKTPQEKICKVFLSLLIDVQTKFIPVILIEIPERLCKFIA